LPEKRHKNRFFQKVSPKVSPGKYVLKGLFWTCSKAVFGQFLEAIAVNFFYTLSYI
jgi:hypothetical protein